MHKGIATVSVSGALDEKLAAIAAAKFDGIEIFDNDLVASPLKPLEVAQRCADLGLSIDLFQPVRDVEGTPQNGSRTSCTGSPASSTSWSSSASPRSSCAPTPRGTQSATATCRPSS
jgi:hypothetical protein